MSRRSDALDKFRATARRMKPTKLHRAVLWENMLGTVFARNAAGVVEYFDYDYPKALAHIGPHRDVRVARATEWNRFVSGDERPRIGQLVWFAILIDQKA